MFINDENINNLSDYNNDNNYIDISSSHNFN